MRRLLLTLGLSGLLAAPAVAGVLGVADSTGPFQIERDGETLRAPLGSAALRDGDVVASDRHDVKLQDLDGSVVVLLNNSKVQVQGNRFVLREGAVAVHPAKGDETVPFVLVDDLRVAPEEGDDLPKIVTVERLDADQVRVRTVAGGASAVGGAEGTPMRVHSPATGTQYFARQDGIWMPAAGAAAGSAATTTTASRIGAGRGVFATAGDGTAVGFFFDFPGDDDLEVSTSGQDESTRNAVNNPNFDPTVRGPIVGPDEVWTPSAN